MTKLGGIGESELLRRILPYLATEGFEVAAGEDDAAAWGDGTGFTVASCDISVEGVHFDLGWMTSEDAGWRALALALGDLAAKGATPWWGLVSIACPRSWSIEDVEGLYRGMADLAHRVQLSIVGGDMSAIEGPAVLSITVVGRSKARPLPRSEAQPGWAVGVTGALGGSSVALKQRQARRFEPLLAEGLRLNEAGLCCGDISDGLVREMHKFAEMSGAGCVIRATDVPIAVGATLEDALTSGEEPELVCVGREELVRAAGLRVIGVLTEDPTIRVVGADEMLINLKLNGYDHFA
jgi:thiamine-monophosphate kinase